MIACIGIGIGIGIGNGIGNGIPQHRCVKAFDNGARPHNRETVSCRASVDSYRDYDCWLFFSNGVRPHSATRHGDAMSKSQVRDS